MKKSLCAIVLLALLLLLLLPRPAKAEYINPASRISFYYQHDGGARSVEGKWDRLLADRLMALCGHSSVYPYTDQYLTGRGCCLFTFSHAWQFLLGYASGDAAKSDILYRYLSQKPVWSNTGSTLSPPNAASYYASYLKKQSGVTQYTGSLSTYKLLSAFLSGGQSCVVVNAPGHYILATGCTVYQGVQYVQVVDSILSATVQSGRLSRGMSYDFSYAITPANAGQLQAAVHCYWLPYSEFASRCKLKYAFRRQAQAAPSAQISQFILAPGQSAQIELLNAPEQMQYQSLDESICSVSEDGIIRALSPGKAQVLCLSSQSSARNVTIEVYCALLPPQQTLITAPGEALPDPEYEGELPPDVRFSFSLSPQQTGAYECEIYVSDARGSVWQSAPALAVVLDPQRLILIPPGVSVIEESAFEGTDACALALPESVQVVQAGAFSDASLNVVFIESASTRIDETAFDSDVVLCYDYAAFRRWLSARAQDD